MSLELDIACLRAPCEPGDTISVVQLIARAKMAADQLEAITDQRDELLAALRALYGWTKAEVEHFGATCPDDFIIEMVENALAAIEAEKPACRKDRQQLPEAHRV